MRQALEVLALVTNQRVIHIEADVLDFLEIQGSVDEDLLRHILEFRTNLVFFPDKITMAGRAMPFCRACGA